MKAMVSSCIRFDVDDCPPKAFEKLRRDLSFVNPEYVKRQRLGLYLDETPPRIDTLFEHHGHVVIPRGAVGLLVKRLQECGESVDFDDRRVVLDSQWIHRIAQPHRRHVGNEFCHIAGSQCFACHRTRVRGPGKFAVDDLESGGCH